MNDEWKKIQKEFIKLYPGIELCYLKFSSASFSIHHEAMAHMIQINYCKSGQIVWETGNGNHIYLNPGDFSLHTMKDCTNSVLSFPSGMYQGLVIYINLQEISDNPPELLKDNNMFETILPAKFSQIDHPVFLAGNEQTESIFSAFYNQPKALLLSYQKIKVLELLLYLAKTEFAPQTQLSEYQSGQIEIIRKIHDQILMHLEQRLTIEELSKEYHINPTTLKNAFKSVYGTSIAAHIKEHRMVQAAKMLKETNKSVAEIARAVGYDSQSKFTAAFKTYFKVLPKDYRKK